MNKRPLFGPLHLLVIVAVAGCLLTPTQGIQDPPAAASSPDSITVTMQRCNVSREEFDAGNLLLGGTKTVKYNRKGAVTVDGSRFWLYLPRSKSYTIRNSGKDDSHYENKSTRLFIDADDNGKLDNSEAWFANLPVRIGDHMFDVTAIADDGSTLTLRPSRAPLRGLILGRKCPDFSYTTADGQHVSRDTYRGRAFLLDIWSVT